MTISVCAIMKNEQQRVVQFLQSVSLIADEIILVDNGSTDETISMASQFDCKIIRSDKDFDLARNDYIEAAAGDWILTLDLDEIILPEHLKDIRRELEKIDNDPLCRLVYLPRYEYFGGGKWAVWNLSRLVRNDKAHFYSSAIHGSIASSVYSQGGKGSYLYAPIHHLDGLRSEEEILEKRKRNILLMQKELEQDPDNTRIHLRLATEYCALENYELAEKHCITGCELDKDNYYMGFEQLSKIYYCNQELDKSIHTAEQQIEIYKEKIRQDSPKSLRFFKSIDACRVVCVHAYMAKGCDKEAVDLCIQNINENPELAHNYVNAFILDNSRIDLLKTAVKKNPMLLNMNIYSEERRWTLYSQSSAILPNSTPILPILSSMRE